MSSSPKYAFLLALLLVVVANVSSFTPVVPRASLVVSRSSSFGGRLFMSNEQPTEEEKESAAAPVVEDATPAPSPPVQPAAMYVPQAKSTEPIETDAEYPIALPSPILLASAMVLCIVSTGSVFELTGGNPQFGFGPTAAIVAVGLPTSLFLFFAAIKKATAETEEDDKKFLSGRK